MSKRLLFFDKCSPITIARPSPNIVKCPNWWPAYAYAIVSDPSGSKFPEKIEAKFLSLRSEKSNPNSLDKEWFRIISSGAFTGVGASLVNMLPGNLVYVLSKRQPILLLYDTFGKLI